jgi:ABC-2 type transport system ATP-binding protein
MVGLDPASRYQVKRTLRSLNQEGSTIFFSSHILGDIQDIASRLVILRQGRLDFAGTIEELQTRFGALSDVELVTADGCQGWPQGAALPGLVEVVGEPSGRCVLHFEAGSDLEENIDRVLKLLLGRGQRIRSIGPANADLEELYIRHIEKAES